VSDNKKDNIQNEEFQNKKISNNLPEFDENMLESLRSMDNKGRNIRSADDDLDDDLQETDFDLFDDNKSQNVEDNDILNSLINYSSNNKEHNPTPVEDAKSSLLSNISKSFKKEKSDKVKKEKVKKEPKAKVKKEKPKKEKKSFLFGKKKEKQIRNPLAESNIYDEQSEFLGSDVSEDTIDDVMMDDDVNTIEDIEKNIKSFKNLNNSKKLLVIIGAVVIGILLLLTIIFTSLKFFEKEPPVETPVPVEQEEIIDTDELDTTEYISKNINEKQGYIKRILGNKVIITPDDETEDIIYYVDSVVDLKDVSAGAHVQFEYKIVNYIPRISSITQIKTGEVVYKGIMTLNIIDDKTPVKYSYDEELEEVVKKIRTGDEVSYVSKDIDGVLTITNIINVNGLSSNNETIYEVEDAVNPVTDDLYSGYVFNKEDFYEEYLTVNNRPEETRNVVKSHIENNTIAFHNGISNPIWIRFAWRITDLAQSVPNIENVDIVLETPSGVKINHTNIDTHGRMWVDGDIVNFALKNPEVGEYKIITNKAKGTHLGEAQIFVMELSGFITIEKFGANLLDRDNLELIWNIGGVPDDGLEIEVYLTNERFSTMIYSGSSKDEILHTVDRRVVNISNLPKGKYNIIVKVKDLDLKTREDNPEIPENTIVVAAETITDTKNMGILILQ
jgi:hypothetical protein